MNSGLSVKIQDFNVLLPTVEASGISEKGSRLLYEP